MTDIRKPADLSAAKPAEKPADKADDKADKPVESASAAPGEKRSASRPLAKASESGDATVHKAMADLYTAQQNVDAHKDLDGLGADALKVHEDEVAKAKDALAELGYE